MSPELQEFQETLRAEVSAILKAEFEKRLGFSCEEPPTEILDGIIRAVAPCSDPEEFSRKVTAHCCNVIALSDEGFYDDNNT